MPVTPRRLSLIPGGATVPVPGEPGFLLLTGVSRYRAGERGRLSHKAERRCVRLLEHEAARPVPALTWN